MSVKGNSTDTTSPGLKVVIDGVFRRVVLKEGLDRESLPLKVFGIPANQVRQIPIQPKLVGEWQQFDGFFDFLNGCHDAVSLDQRLYTEIQKTRELVRMLDRRKKRGQVQLLIDWASAEKFFRRWYAWGVRRAIVKSCVLRV